MNNINDTTIVDYLKREGDSFRAGVYQVGTDLLYISMDNRNLLVEDSQYQGFRLETGLLGSVVIKRNEKYFDLMDSIEKFKNFTFVGEDFTTRAGPPGRCGACADA